jgi:NAD-dependent deacetylase
MKTISLETVIDLLTTETAITFLTGAGVSTASGVPDYRSLSGVYHGVERPEYLLSHTCLRQEPQKFYEFVKTLYHPSAKPNIIHQKIAALERNKRIWVVSQNIDGLHRQAGSRNVVDFHGNLYECYCQKCAHSISYHEYLKSDRHDSCGGQIRPAITLYEEGLNEQAIQQAVSAVEAAQLIVVVGTSFQVHPFCDLIYYAQPTAKVVAINQTPITMNREFYFLQENAVTVFENLPIKE